MSTTAYATRSQAELDHAWACQSCGAAIAEVIELGGDSLGGRGTSEALGRRA